jgi:hypothetical protein
MKTLQGTNCAGKTVRNLPFGRFLLPDELSNELQVMELQAMSIETLEYVHDALYPSSGEPYRPSVLVF